MPDDGTHLLVVDGMNLIGSRPDGWWRDRHRAQRELVARLAVGREGADETLLVVFDGRPPADGISAPAGVTVVFTPGSTADDEIVRRVEGRPAEVQATVVTSDVGLAGRVRALGAQVMGVGRFRAMLERPADR